MIRSTDRARTRSRRLAAVAVSAALLLGVNAGRSLADDRGDNNENQHDNQHDSEHDSHDDEHENGTPATPKVCASDKTRNYTINEATLPFTALPGTTTQRSWGVLNFAGYEVEVPQNWNGELVMWAHGFAGWGCDLGVDRPPIRQYLVSHGYAWAASSYAANGYAVQQGVDDTMALLRHFKRTIAKPHRVFMTGASMGGHITGVAIEQNEDSFDGAMPVCGVMGSETLFDYFLDYNELAQAISGVQSPYPYGVDYFPVYVPQIKAALGAPTSLKFQTFAAAVMQRSGGTRPGFGVALGAWLDFVFGIVQPNPGVVPAFAASNVDTVYQLDTNPAVSSAEAALNASMRRVSRLDFPTPDGVVPVPKIEGELHMPVLTLHTIGDLFVPFSMEQIYARRVAANGRSKLLVQRAIRDVGHCSFTLDEMNRGFDDLAVWVHNGTKPAGDNVLDPAVVANPTYGCTFTTGVGGTPARPSFGPCP